MIMETEIWIFEKFAWKEKAPEKEKAQNFEWL